jgi:Rrf2 family protein
MDLTLSRRGDYMVRAAIFLADRWDGDGGYCKIREVSAEMDLPASYTPQLLGVLAKAGLAEARAGRRGGYRLVRDPATIPVLDVIEAAEGTLSSRRCPMRGGPCHWDNVCALHPTWVKASEAIRSTLRETSLAEVAAEDRRLAKGESTSWAPPGHRSRTPDARSTGADPGRTG